MPHISANELEVLRGLYAAGMTNVAVKTICDYLPDSLHEDRGGVSSRLCKLRGKNLVYSEMVGNVNLWTLKDEGMAALRGDSAVDAPDISPDISVSTGIPVTEQNQPDSVDISPDILAPDPVCSNLDPVCSDHSEYDQCERIAARIAAVKAVAEANRSDQDIPEVAPDLIEEANALRLRRPLPREQDALYVLSVLIDTLGRDSPAMAYELTRVAAYIEGEYA